ncbi:MAG: DNA and RNA helicase [archaeon GW2011_AR18]|nr:MAG: DNA and RNA helicase [archaeon GW2011_AR18]
MKLLGDFHIHGPYANACSKNTTLKLLEDNSKIKGLNIIGTGDCLHNRWFSSIKSELNEDENGVLWSKNKFPFLWTSEISLMYSHNNKGRRIHHVLLFPNREVVQQVTDLMLTRGRLDYDGRPIFGINSIEFVDMMRSVSHDIEIIPGHIWTSFFGLLGSKSGFDSVEECFEDRSKYIHALESGISSDPFMNRKISSLDKYNIVSFSDPHSSHPSRLGREATIFDCDLKYKSILNSIRTGEGLKGTIEASPEYGKYHIDGHRNCNIMMNYEESKKLNKICPVCKKEMTIGVEYRIEELADRKEPENVPYYIKILPLHELISAVYGVKQFTSKKVIDIYNILIKNFNTEYNILLEVPEEKLKTVIDEKLARVIILNRMNKLKINPGYDGVYGEIVLDDKEKFLKKNKSLGDF